MYTAPITNSSLSYTKVDYRFDIIDFAMKNNTDTLDVTFHLNTGRWEDHFPALDLALFNTTITLSLDFFPPIHQEKIMIYECTCRFQFSLSTNLEEYGHMIHHV